MPGFFQRNTIRQRDTLVHDIAERSAAEAKRRLRRDTAAMSAAELRGYVRAAATHVVNQQARQLLLERRVSSPQMDDVIVAALERTVHLVVRELLVPPVVTIPTPHVRGRIAA